MAELHHVPPPAARVRLFSQEANLIFDNITPSELLNLIHLQHRRKAEIHHYNLKNT